MTGATPSSSMLFITRAGDSEKTDKPGVVFTGQKLSCIHMTNAERQLELMKASGSNSRRPAASLSTGSRPRSVSPFRFGTWV